MTELINTKINIDKIIKSSLNMKIEEILYGNMPITINNQVVGIVRNKEDISLWFDFVPYFILEDDVFRFMGLEIKIKDTKEM